MNLRNQTVRNQWHENQTQGLDWHRGVNPFIEDEMTDDLKIVGASDGHFKADRESFA